MRFTNRLAAIGMAGTTVATALLLASCGADHSDSTTTSADQSANDNRSTVMALDTEAMARAEAMLATMTFDQKLNMVHGRGLTFLTGRVGAGYLAAIDELGIPETRYADSGSGVSEDNANVTGFPDSLALTASWNPELMESVAERIGLEGKQLGYSGLLGAGVNMARELRNGRTYEYMGEDPVLAASMVAARVKGIQSQDVMAIVKHFAANDQETNRFAYNSVVEERALREIHLWPFEVAITQQQPAGVMCSYNRVNGAYSCENQTLLTDILKNEWGFNGFVQTDWFASAATVAAATAGADEEMPGSPDNCATENAYGIQPCYASFDASLKTAIETDGTVPAARLDDMVLRKLYSLYRFDLIDHPSQNSVADIDAATGDALSLASAAQSIVLLKNSAATDDQAAVLPLQNRAQKILLVGGHADKGVMGGGGSARASYRSDANAADVDCLTPGAIDNVIYTFSLCAPWFDSAPLTELQALLPEADIHYLDGTDQSAAVAAASEADVVIVFGTQFSMEVYDLPDLRLPDAVDDPANQAYDQDALISALAAANEHTVVVLEHGTAVVMPWLDDVKAVVAAWYPGIKGGEAIAQVLTGVVNPSGKLPITFPQDATDQPQTSISSTDLEVTYSEGSRVGYRWYDDNNLDVLFPFGYGLSYTRFGYSGLAVSSTDNGDVQVTLTVSNTGERAGADVVQVYASLPDGVDESPQRLVAYQRVELAAGETQALSLTIPKARFATWQGSWKVAAGSVVIRVGQSSRDYSALSGVVTMTAADVTHAE